MHGGFLVWGRYQGPSYLSVRGGAQTASNTIKAKYEV
jgi:hypothetical protein